MSTAPEYQPMRGVPNGTQGPRSRRRQPWYPLAASVEIRRYANWTTAAYFEALAIKDEQPAWNVTPEAASLRKAPRIRPEPIEPDERFPIEYWNRSKT